MQPPYHPLFVHFPIALYFLGVLMTLAALLDRRASAPLAEYDRFAYWAFFLSWLAAIVASLVGLIDRGQLDFDDPRRDALDQHISQAILFMIFNGLLLYMRFRWPDMLHSRRRWFYLALMALGAVTLAATGWFGGELVYELQVGVR